MKNQEGQDLGDMEHPAVGSLRRRRKFFWWSLGSLVAILFFFVTAANAAWEPTNLLYPAKRLGEKMLTALTPNMGQGIGARDRARLKFANHRVQEAATLVQSLAQKPPNQQLQNSATIDAALAAYTDATASVTLTLGQNLDRKHIPPPSVTENLEGSAVGTYVMLEQLRVAASPPNQAAVLQALAALQEHLATLQDAAAAVPVGPNEIKVLSDLVATGFLTKANVDQLLAEAHTNRGLLAALRTLVQDGQIPAITLFEISTDQITEKMPDAAPRFVASIRFDELRKTALLIKSLSPTPREEKVIASFLKNYQAGQALPTAAKRFTAPLLFGLHLVDEDGIDLAAIDGTTLSSERKLFYDLWQPILASTGMDANRYTALLATTNQKLVRNADLLERVQLEVLKAIQGNVAYLALPVGWRADDALAIQDVFQDTIAQLRAAEVSQTKRTKAIAALASVTQPLLTTATTKQVDDLRQQMKKEVEKLRDTLVKQTLAATPAPSLPTNTEQIAALDKRLTQAVADLQQQVTGSTDQVAALAGSLANALTNLTAANVLLQDQVIADATLRASAQEAISDIRNLQKETHTGLSAKIADLPSATSTERAALVKSVDDLARTQTAKAASLEAQLMGQGALRSALELSVITLTQTHQEQVQQLQSRLAGVESTNLALRQDLQAAITNMQDTQAAAQAELDATVLTVGSKLSQAIAEVQTVQTQAATETQTVRATVTDLTQSVATLRTGQTQLAADLVAYADQTAAIRSELTQSIGQLQQAQAATATELAALQANVGNVTQSVQRITATQTAAQLQIDNLLSVSADWTNLAATVRVDLDALARLEVELATSFAQKSAALDAKYDAYQQQVDANIQRLNTVTNEQILRLQQQVETLQAQLQVGTNTSVNTSVAPQTNTSTNTTVNADVSAGTNTSIGNVNAEANVNVNATVPGL